jgi:hypothetical protein
VKSAFANSLHRFVIQADGMGIFLAANVCRDRGFEPVLAELLEHGSTKLGIIQRCGSESDEWVSMPTLESILVSVRNPERQEP